MNTPVFSFGLITDTHVRPPQGDDSSPFPVNDLANGRARFAAALLASHNPEFTIHLGDMVHTLPHMPLYDDACRESLKILSPLAGNLHFMPGNHDIGDKPMPASPAAGYNSDSNSRYAKHFGAGYSAFSHQGCAFILINSSLLNSGDPAETEQQHWLQQQLQQHEGKRIFLFCHYPLFLHDPDEAEHYDNIAQPARDWLLDLIRSHDVEAVFSGHVHHFFCNSLFTQSDNVSSVAGKPTGDSRTEQSSTLLFCLPPTSFTRQDYAEMYRTEPGDEFGRNDTGKFSVTMVDVYETSFRLRVIPTDGRTLESAESPSRPVRQSADSDHTITNKLCVPLRHAWHESIHLPFNGPMEEYARKQCRNDYTLMRLLQTGINKARVPLTDLQHPQIRQRMQVYKRLGITFQVFKLGLPSQHELELISQHAELLCALEVVTPVFSPTPQKDNPGILEESLQALSPLIADNPHFPSLVYSKAHSSAHSQVIGKTFAHSVTNGFLWQEANAVFLQLNELDPQKNIDAVTFQVPFEEQTEPLLEAMLETATTSSYRIIASLRFATMNPATCNYDDRAIAARLATALEMTQDSDRLGLQLDTFVDVDRGYGPRHGLLDRQFNLRPAGRSLAGLAET